jgi:peptide/nickel transport system ATP-binding protein
MTSFLTDQSAVAQSRPADSDSFLVVENLSVQFPTHDGLVNAVNDLTYSVKTGETLGIVGESGSGKSVTSLAILGLLRGAEVTGEIRLGDRQLVGADP